MMEDFARSNPMQDAQTVMDAVCGNGESGFDSGEGA
jgi:hypothetical protein